MFGRKRKTKVTVEQPMRITLDGREHIYGLRVGDFIDFVDALKENEAPRWAQVNIHGHVLRVEWEEES